MAAYIYHPLNNLSHNFFSVGPPLASGTVCPTEPILGNIGMQYMHVHRLCTTFPNCSYCIHTHNPTAVIAPHSQGTTFMHYPHQTGAKITLYTLQGFLLYLVSAPVDHSESATNSSSRTVQDNSLFMNQSGCQKISRVEGSSSSLKIIQKQLYMTTAVTMHMLGRRLGARP